MFRVLMLAVAALAVAACTAIALSELATPKGVHTVHSKPEFLTRALGAPRPAASLVGTLAHAERRSL